MIKVSKLCSFSTAEVILGRPHYVDAPKPFDDPGWAKTWGWSGWSGWSTATIGSLVFFRWSSRAQAKNLINCSAGREFQGNSIRMDLWIFHDLPVESDLSDLSDLSGRRALEHSCMSGSCHSVIGRLGEVGRGPNESNKNPMTSDSQQDWGEAHWSSFRQSQNQLHHLKKSLIERCHPRWLVFSWGDRIKAGLPGMGHYRVISESPIEWAWIPLNCKILRCSSHTHHFKMASSTRGTTGRWETSRMRCQSCHQILGNGCVWK